MQKSKKEIYLNHLKFHSPELLLFIADKHYYGNFPMCVLRESQLYKQTV